MAIVMETCSNCGAEYKKHLGRRGKCPPCVRWERTHDTPRPPDYKRRIEDCTNCGESRTWGQGGNGLCHKCYQYQHRYGTPRPLTIRLRKPGDPILMCKSCRIRLAKFSPGRRLCKTCAEYMRRNNGKRRPRYLDAEQCVHCGKPKGGEYFAKGHCHACDDYQRKYNKPRPAHLWQNPHGWCDCGKPATHTVTMRVMHHDEHYPLCDGCYAEHQRQVAWYGSPDITTKGNIQAQRKSSKLYGDD